VVTNTLAAPPPTGHSQGQVAFLKFWGPQSYLQTGETGHFDFGLQIDCGDKCTLFSSGVCSCSCYWSLDLSDSMSEMVQDKRR